MAKKVGPNLVAKLTRWQELSLKNGYVGEYYSYYHNAVLHKQPSVLNTKAEGSWLFLMLQKDLIEKNYLLVKKELENNFTLTQIAMEEFFRLFDDFFFTEQASEKKISKKTIFCLDINHQKEFLELVDYLGLGETEGFRNYLWQAIEQAKGRDLKTMINAVDFLFPKLKLTLAEKERVQKIIDLVFVEKLYLLPRNIKLENMGKMVNYTMAYNSDLERMLVGQVQEWFKEDAWFRLIRLAETGLISSTIREVLLVNILEPLRLLGQADLEASLTWPYLLPIAILLDALKLQKQEIDIFGLAGFIEFVCDLDFAGETIICDEEFDRCKWNLLRAQLLALLAVSK